MPNLDGTGPNGEGPMTGRGRGKCQDKEPVQRACGRQQGCGRGAGRNNPNRAKNA